MPIYISMLRGINVSGQKRIKMDDLAALFSSLGFVQVKTYLQSGNVVFGTSEQDTLILSKLIEEKIKQFFGFPVPVIIRTSGEVRQIINDNPFIQDKGIDISQLYVTFLTKVPIESNLTLITKIADQTERFILANREIYLYCPNGYAKTKFSNSYFEKKLAITATTRNWNTVNALMEIADGNQLQAKSRDF